MLRKPPPLVALAPPGIDQPQKEKTPVFIVKDAFREGLYDGVKVYYFPMRERSPSTVMASETFMREFGSWPARTNQSGTLCCRYFMKSAMCNKLFRTIGGEKAVVHPHYILQLVLGNLLSYAVSLDNDSINIMFSRNVRGDTRVIACLMNEQKWALNCFDFSYLDALRQSSENHVKVFWCC